MLIIELPKYSESLIAEIQNTFDNCQIVEVNSLGTDTIIQILIPTITVGIPAASAIIVQVLKNTKAIVKYNNIEVTGTPKSITKILEAMVRAESLGSDNSESPEGNPNGN